jgi:hypothetical protein
MLALRPPIELVEHRRNVDRNRIGHAWAKPSMLRKECLQTACERFEKPLRDLRQTAQLSKKVVVFLKTLEFLLRLCAMISMRIQTSTQSFIGRSSRPVSGENRADRSRF